MSEGEISCPGVTGVPESSNCPTVGSVSMRIADSELPVSTSANAKSLNPKVKARSSVAETLRSEELGGSATGATLINTVLLAVPPLPSLIVYVTVSVPLKCRSGV